MDEKNLERVEENLRELVERTAKAIGNRPSLKPCKACYYCDENISAGKLFCNSECASDYEYEQKTRKAQGR
jgi:hypothetical protein